MIHDSFALNDVGKDVFDTWIVDSGAIDHMIYDIRLFSSYRSLRKPIKVVLPDGTLKTVEIAGKIQINKDLVVDDVLLVEGFKQNLLSVTKLLDQNKLVGRIESNGIYFQDHTTKRIVAKGHRAGGLFLLKSEARVQHQKSLQVGRAMSNHAREINFDVIHARLGHCSNGKLKHIQIYCSDVLPENKVCETCVLAKHCKEPFDRSNAIVEKRFDLVHMDLWGPYKFI